MHLPIQTAVAPHVQHQRSDEQADGRLRLRADVLAGGRRLAIDGVGVGVCAAGDGLMMHPLIRADDAGVVTVRVCTTVGTCRINVEGEGAGPIEAFVRAVGTVQFIVVKTLTFIGQLLTGTGDYQQLSGPIGIASVSGQILVYFGIVTLINLAAVLSVSIGLLNLFPIPMLDGGHLLYYGIEAVRGRPLGERAQELGFRIGFALVISLMLFATFNDIVKLQLF